METPRQVDAPLVEAYLARRALDYLVGFNLSPVLWRKLPGAKSAGRVQSVCLRLIVEREMEIEAFRAREYWGVAAALKTPRGKPYEARLVTLAGRKLDRFDIQDRASAELAVQAVASRALRVASVEAKPASRNPAAPFMTSTLQQEASRKFGMGAKQTMSAAQRLYEAGHITYMRTDGIDMAPEAVMAARDFIKSEYGADYVPQSPRMYKNKAKNAQEAHECIRPTEMAARPDRLRLAEADQRRLYELIWKRSIACQMEAARLERTTVEIASEDGEVGLRATGQRVVFDGFMRVYTEGRDEPEGGDDDRILPQIMQGEPAAFAGGLRGEFDKIAAAIDSDALIEDASPSAHVCAAAVLSQNESVLARQSFTQPPPRYTEATLVKRMEELGIGRPSTYASIVTTIQDREYVRKDGGRLIPEDKGRLVTAFLANYFRRYVEYDFTADLEAQLDDVSAGERDYRDVLARFWADFHAAVEDTAELRITDVLEKINEVLEPHIFPDPGDGTDPRLCPACHEGRLSMRTARSGGAFIGCSRYPECRYTRPFGPPGGDEGEAAGGDRVLGEDGGDQIALKSGRFGPYVQRGEGADGEKPPRASIPKGWDPARVTLAEALRLLGAAAAHRPPPRGRRARGGRPRPLRSLRQARPHLRQPAEHRGRVRDRHEPRRRGAGPEGRRPRRTRRRQGAGRGRRAPRRGADRRDGRALRPLREVGQGQRHPAQRDGARGREPRPCAGADRREGGQGRQEARAQGRAEEGGSQGQGRRAEGGGHEEARGQEARRQEGAGEDARREGLTRPAPR